MQHVLTWRTIAATIKADRYQLRSHTKNKWQNETGSVEGLARRPVGKVNRPSDLEGAAQEEKSKILTKANEFRHSSVTKHHEYTMNGA